MKDHYLFHPQLILRTPARPFSAAISETTVRAALADEEFMEAIYLASPALHAECGKWQRGELTDERKMARLRHTLTRYYTRFTSRCTPFGLFAGCSLVEWGPEHQLERQPTRDGRHTRLDMHYLCALAQHLASWPEVKAELRYQPNTSLYRLGAEYRYVERQYVSGECLHQVCAVEASEFLVRALALASAGGPLAELVARASENEADAPEVSAFLDELAETQVLVSELEPTVTGAEFFQHLRAVMHRLASRATPSARLAGAVQVLDEVHTALTQLDEPGQNTAADYERIAVLLAPLGIPPETGKLFQTDAIHGLGNAVDATAMLDKALQKPLQEALAVLELLAPRPRHARLEDFIRRFQARYEDQEVALLEALDTESGLAYTDYGSARYSALVHGLVLPEPNPAAKAPDRNAAQQWLHQRVQEAGHRRQYALDINHQELRAQVPAPDGPPLPPSVGVLFRLIDADHILLEGIGGSSAVNLLGRFAHAAPAIEQLVETLTRHEQAHNPGVCFAEIGHLPARRVGNLLQRPHSRAVEIPYLAQSTRPVAEQLPVQELTLAVRHGQLVLRSSRTRQRIVPRLGTAHNFGGDALPVYQLLCDLQTQGVQSQLGISWEVIAPDARFTPRLTCGRVVLAPATWRLRAADFQGLLAAPASALAAAFAAFRAEWQLPRFFMLAESDNELLVDADNAWLVQVWLSALRPLASVVLKEFLFDTAASPIRDAAARPYVGQCIALLMRQTPAYAGLSAGGAPAPATSPEPVRRDFAPGSEWLYYKLYCGQLVADRVLLEALQPLAAVLLEQGLIDNWFFIRYADPDPHLRVRWHLPDPGHLGTVVRLVGEYLAPLSGNHLIWKTQIDTYRRELERYGSRTIGAAEALFGYQTQALLARMAQAASEDSANELWAWGLGAVDELLTAFGYSLERKRDWAAGLRAAFMQEFGASKALQLQLDARYRAERATVQDALDPTAHPALPVPLQAIAREVLAHEVHGQLEVPLDELLGSFAHMLLNRLLPAEPRLHELVLYDFLHRHYRAALARAPAATSCRS